MRDFFGDEKYKKIVISFVITLIVAVVAFAIILLAYNQKMKENVPEIGSVAGNTANDIVSNDRIETNEASTTEDKAVDDAITETIENIEEEQADTKETVSDESEVLEEETETQEVEPVAFIAPVSGEILTDFAEDSLIYSNTLEEWTTHLGIDIKADKASVVVAAESGTVKSIKNDPRYGLTITIEHNENFETVYANLLSSEFVNEGDQVEKGQTIGTVGESASFEIAEVPHLHFEMYKDGVVVNPTLYLK